MRHGAAGKEGEGDGNRRTIVWAHTKLRQKDSKYSKDSKDSKDVQCATQH